MIAGDEGQSAPRLQSTSVSCDAAKFPIIYPGAFALPTKSSNTANRNRRMNWSACSLIVFCWAS